MSGFSVPKPPSECEVPNCEKRAVHNIMIKVTGKTISSGVTSDDKIVVFLCKRHYKEYIRGKMFPAFKLKDLAEEKGRQKRFGMSFH